MTDIYTCEIVSNERLADAVYAVSFVCGDIAGKARAGQFINIKCGAERLLRRPVSICQASGDVLKFVFEVKGEGTRWLAGCKAGQELDILGPLGNGFDIPDGKFIAVGGGIGIPPLLFAVESAIVEAPAILGFRSADRVILKKEFKSVCESVYITTDDGSMGIHGTAITQLEELLRCGAYDAVIACGPRVMLSAVAALCAKHNVSCQVSLEERMGCGVGACLGCACATRTGRTRVCKDGPVFNAKEVVW
ncbi:MAG: dihydroorotate dehydrogenase electron transfer subunit [Oscillospiraceae bacterium]|jgi:dihydroorotate dehydrogenase electron transfer subunit|nr:dihydroorotate dehydrogenase electron transfer subunit [Oscillospiraceae bacterium]